MIETVTVRTCDLDGDKPRKADKTTLLGFEGIEYETELCPKHERALSAIMAELIPVARKASNGRPAGKSPARDRERSKAIRAWAQENDLMVADRGKIPDSVIEAYDARK